MPSPQRPVSHRIRSFVMRAGRMTTAQERGWQDGFPHFGLEVSAGVLDWNATFVGRGRRIVEIGFGMGGSLLQMAGADPNTQFLGIEVHRPGVGRLLGQLEANNCRNVRVYAEDAVEVLDQCLACESIDAFHIFFPDPWHKKRHHKRRLIQPELVSELTKRLRPEGYLHLATDWGPYAEHMFDVLDAEPQLRNVRGTPRMTSPRPEYRPQTKFELRGERLGHAVWDLIYRRR
ncbi:MAG: tRNA (guanosine(46)-N7)-methyltransferase TrmB [Luminiphilus sp.]|jgi:tRNA (guanine-N7-)-methyltransferase|nr:tRNA (guanosine(46)-N7)-methyltransferase TrmB [Luminiphilus sp.]